jgi:cytochrome c-type biogenesis protein
MASDITLPAVLGAGVLSFLSPCVLPLVPPYLCFLAGTTLDELVAEDRPRKARRDVLITAVLFVLGFATVFIALGATASALGQFVARQLPLLAQIAGVLIVLAGLHFLGLFRISLLYREARLRINWPASRLGAYLMGLAFALGWTPCIGPILAVVLGVAAAESTLARGAGLLAVYAAGLGIPFLIAAFAMRSFVGFLGHFRRHLGTVEKVMGAALVVTGIAFFTGWLQDASSWLLDAFPALARLG